MTSPDVELKGKLFHQPGKVLDYHVGVMTRDLAEQAQMAIKFQGQSSFRYERSLPTGEWSRSIKVRQARDAASGRYRSGYSVHDSGIVYGPWLEGVGSRNLTSRFKGYHTFRKVRDEIARKAPNALIPETRRMAKDLQK